MASIKVTFTLDRTSLDRLQDAADQRGVAKSALVREAIVEFDDRLGKWSDRERAAMLRTVDEVVPKIPAGSAAAGKRELAEGRRARKAGGRRATSSRL